MIRIKYIQILEWVIGLSFLAFIVMSAYQLWWPYEVIRFKEVRILNPDRITRGSAVWIDILYDKLMPIPADVVKVVVCGNKVIVVSKEIGANPMGQDKHTVVPVIIPEITPKGEKCYIRSVYTYHVNPLRSIPVVLETPCFTVN